ncbi:hypothetical protein PRZ48_002274 [Zasmidium cellare]|uniref:Uncharacterized protein n=1 Tax=Zasmidium cellare TaxID=395010 RepID=A0ABR0F496_ZASCE|nr:hypothetical protein PRZ48_002274 [Zasmidium cellare]
MARLGLQFCPTPQPLVGPLDLPPLDQYTPATSLKSASTIYPTESRTEITTFDSGIQRCLKLLYTLKGRVDQEDYLHLIGDRVSQDAFKDIKAQCQKFVSKLQGASISTSPKQWFAKFVSTHVEKEHQKVPIYNLHRHHHISQIRRPTTTDAEHQANLTFSHECLQLANRLKQNWQTALQKHMTAIWNGTAPLFPFREREVGKSSDDALNFLKTKEYKRLQKELDEVCAWPESRFDELGIDLPINAGNEIPELYTYGKRNEAQRLQFWYDRVNEPELVSFFRPVIDVVEILPSLAHNNRIFGAYATTRMAHACDEAFFSFTSQRLQNDWLKHVDQVSLRVSFEWKTHENEFFAYMRTFYEMYKSNGLDDGRGTPTLDDIQIKGYMSLTSTPDRRKRTVVPNHNIGGLPPGFRLNLAASRANLSGRGGIDRNARRTGN